jgi:transcriptional/translational regulatory protein YebC/TACO1
MAEPGSVAWQFERKGVIVVAEKAPVVEDDLMLAALEAGAEDITDAGDHWQVTTPPSDLPAVRSALEGSGIPFESAEVTMLPTTTVPLDNESDAKKVLHVIDLLEEHDDVQNVYANFEVSDALVAKMSA